MLSTRSIILKFMPQSVRIRAQCNNGALSKLYNIKPDLRDHEIIYSEL